MANLFVTEFQNLAQTDVPAVNSIQAEQEVAIGESSAASAAFQANTNFIMVCADADCSLAFGTSPTAVATAHFLPANTTRFYAVPVGLGWQVAAIANS